MAPGAAEGSLGQKEVLSFAVLTLAQVADEPGRKVAEETAAPK